MHAYFTTSEFRQALDDDEIDRLVLGEDCIEWLRTELSNRDHIVIQRPVVEDWGSTMALAVDGSHTLPGSSCCGTTARR